MPAEIHVSVTGSDRADGSVDAPKRTINHAAQLARPGDMVIVHEGEYREWVRPPRGGLSDQRRITYAAAPGEHVAIKGSELVTPWRHDGGQVWSAAVPNTLFGDFNPFAEEVDGDWIVYADDRTPKKHLGDVYLNGQSLYEVSFRDEVSNPPPRTEVTDPVTGVVEMVRDSSGTRLVWYAEVGPKFTTIWANFQALDPNEAAVEISVRRSVFYPTEHHVDYITVRGFELAHAASPWAPPTADQPGLIGPNWAKGWIIEDNRIHDAKCSAISIGKEASTGHNHATTRRDKPGYQYQIESVFAARQIGWDREHIGSHLIRGNTIHDCGQAGIVGHLGCAFSTIEENHIYNIGLKREFYGHEIAGIKLHAAIDVIIRRNRIHDCTLATWLDWQTQGTRVSRNLCYANRRDLFVEVSHGPYLVEHNIFASPVSLQLFSQGGAFINNLVCGIVALEPVPDRPTPYHVPHSTQVAGYAAIYGGDDRHTANIYIGGDSVQAYARTARAGASVGYGTAGYNGHPATWEEFLAGVADVTRGDHRRFENAKQPVYIHDNVYAGGAGAFARENGAVVLDGKEVYATVIDEGVEVYLETFLPQSFQDVRLGVTTGRDLKPVRFVDAEFEEPDGTPAVLLNDLIGDVKRAGEKYPPGPLAALTSGVARTRVW
jgi:hypothetical protein